MNARAALLAVLLSASCTSPPRPIQDPRVSVKGTVHGSIPPADAPALQVTCDSRVRWWKMDPPVRAQVRVSVRWFHEGVELLPAEESRAVLKAAPVSFASREPEGEVSDSETFEYARARSVKGAAPAPLPDRVEVTVRFVGKDSGTPAFEWGEGPEAACVFDHSLRR